MSETPIRVLVVDDEESMRAFLDRFFGKRGFTCLLAEDGQVAIDVLERETVDLCLTDLRMPRVDGMQLLAWMGENRPRTPVIVMTGHGSIRNAIEALKAGAENYITKPIERDELEKSVDAALRLRRLAAENVVMRELLDAGRFESLVGASASMRELYHRIEDVARRRGTVLIQGESGTGKELVAQAIHRRGDRSEGPFVPFHCAAIPNQLVAAELFGVEAGAFTGAETTRGGAVARAMGGTLFLDEVGEIPLDVQPALLRLLEDGGVTPLGGQSTVETDVRIVAATHRDLRQAMSDGSFREDLFFRLNVFMIDVPPLRDRRRDIESLARHFLIELGREDLVLAPETVAALEAFDWPGNVRQLQNALARMAAHATHEVLDLSVLPEECRVSEGAGVGSERLALKQAARRFERDYISALLAESGGNVSEAARLAHVSRPTLHAKIKAHGLDPSSFRSRP